MYCNLTTKVFKIKIDNSRLIIIITYAYNKGISSNLKEKRENIYDNVLLFRLNS